MPQPRVSIRLGTDGKAQVVKDFADIGDAGDAGAKRISSAFQRDSAVAEAALEKLNKTAQRLAAVSPVAGGPSNLINPITGGSYAQADGAAQASARAIQQQMQAGEQAARRLLAAVDPLYAAQMRYDTALAEANTLQRQGSMTTAQLATVQTGLKAQLNEQIALYGKVGSNTGNARLAQMEFMHAVRGSADQLAAGAPPMQVFAMHMAMLSQSAQLAGGSLGKVGEFLSSGWGIALVLAVAAMAPMLAKLVQAGESVDDLVEKLKKEAKQQGLNDQAHRAFANTLQGVQDAIRKNAEALKGLDDAEKSAAEKALAAAIAAKTRAQNILNETEANLGLARSLYDVQKARASGMGQQGELAALGLPQAYANLDAQQTKLAAARAALGAADAEIADATARVFAEIAAKDPVELIKDRYKGLVEQARQRAVQEAAAARAAGDQVKAQALVTTELQKQVVALDRKRDAEVKAYQDAHKEGPKNAGGTAIFDAQIASFFDIANKYRGMSETANKGVLEQFFREANENLDPEKVKWCAAFVNAVLAAGGVSGSGSLAAKSFLTYGKDDTKSPQKGDVVVLRSGGGQHVGFLDSIDKAGNVNVLAGNTGNKVAEATYGKGSVLAIRRPPTPSESAAAGESAADSALRAQAAFDEQRARLNERLLRELGQVALGYEAQAAVQLRMAQAEHDSEATKIANQLAEGKYGDATGQLAQSRAAELVKANDALLLQEQANIALGKYAKFLDATQASTDKKYQFQLDDLKYADEVARTAKQHRDLQLKMLDILYEQKKFDLETLKAKQELAGEFAAAANTQADINRLPIDKARDTDRVERSTKSPWQEFLDQLPRDAGEINEALQKIGVEGLHDLNDGLADALLKSRSLEDLWHNLGDVFHDLAERILGDLLRLAEQEAEMAIFGGGQQPGGPASSGGGGGGIFGAIFSGLSALAGGLGGGGGGGWNFGASGGYDAANANLVGGLATGTEYFGGGMTWVGEHGPELMRLPRGSKIHNAADSRRMAAANDGGIGAIHIPIHIDATGADSAELARVRSELAELRESLPGQIVQTYHDARARFVIRN